MYEPVECSIFFTIVSRFQAEEDAQDKDKQLAELLEKMRLYESGQYGLSDAVAEIKECKLQMQIRDRWELTYLWQGMPRGWEWWGMLLYTKCGWQISQLKEAFSFFFCSPKLVYQSL